MKTAVDSSVLLDVLGADPAFGPASREALRAAFDGGALVACDVVWAEVRAHFQDDAEFDDAVGDLGLSFSPLYPVKLRGWLELSGADTTRPASGRGFESSRTSSLALTRRPKQMFC